MALCFLALGSNLRHPQRQLQQGLKLLKSLPHSIMIKKSQIYQSTPCNAHGQPQYCNMVVAIITTLPPLILLQKCQEIEIKSMRFKKNLNQARTLDIDILLYDKRVIKNPKLIIPHPGMLVRDFVLIPLLAIDPKVKLPDNSLVSNYLKKCPRYIIK